MSNALPISCGRRRRPSASSSSPSAYDQRHALSAAETWSWHGTLIENQRDGSGWTYQRARLYDPQTTGRFSQTDPIGIAGGMNGYGFAGQDPINFSDPLGLCPYKSAGSTAATTTTTGDCPSGTVGDAFRLLDSKGARSDRRQSLPMRPRGSRSSSSAPQRGSREGPTIRPHSSCTYRTRPALKVLPVGLFTKVRTLSKIPWALPGASKR